MKIVCKRCEGENITKNGFVHGVQRYRCKSCGCNFVPGDNRIKPNTAIKRAFAVLLYSQGKGSYGFIAKLFGVTRPAVLKWIRQAAAQLPEPQVPATIKEMEFDEMWHFIGEKKQKYGLSKRWIVLQCEPSPGLLAVVMLQPSSDSTIK